MDILSRICVQPPYFALDEMTFPVAGEASARIPVQSPSPEGVISAAETMRHGAILGLCSLASAAPDDGRRYYLATAGIGNWDYDPTTTGQLEGRAIGTWGDKRRGTASIVLTVGRDVVADLVVDYAVFTAAAFARFFSFLHDPDAPDPVGNPHVDGLPLLDAVVDADQGIGSASVCALPEQCAGHFPQYPAVPVAMLLRASMELAGHVVNGDGDQWRITDGSLPPVDRLIPAGEVVSLSARVIHRTRSLRVARIDMTGRDRQRIGHVTYAYTRR